MKILILSLASCWALCAAENDWANLSRELKSGDRIHIVLTSKASIDGLFRSASNDSIAITAAGATDRTIPKAEVVRVSLEGRAHRLRNGILLGIAGGLVGAGATRFGAACAETNDGCRNAALASILGAAGGAVIGALIPARMRVIYRAPKP